ncbi:hypothetical protein Taro_016548 [Colocasia esculenta]|uniref:Uncharacterized protein n=1 Tax=Colocasia esculenta TaxID=4460 RepID=A0A843UE33_COLES|nr:hypothetical protein [Colocasia esculenta]
MEEEEEWEEEWISILVEQEAHQKMWMVGMRVVEKNEEAEELEADPLDLGAGPLQLEAVPLVLGADPLEPEAGPPEVGAVPLDLEAVPLELGADPLEPEAGPPEGLVDYYLCLKMRPDLSLLLFEVQKKILVARQDRFFSWFFFPSVQLEPLPELALKRPLILRHGGDPTCGPWCKRSGIFLFEFLVELFVVFGVEQVDLSGDCVDLMRL